MLNVGSTIFCSYSRLFALNKGDSESEWSEFLQLISNSYIYNKNAFQ